MGISEGAARSNFVYDEWPGGGKAAKQDHMQHKMRDGALYAQAEATKSMAVVQMKKVFLMEDQNMLMLMTMPIEESVKEDTREYLRLRRVEELKKLRKTLLAEESAVQAQQGRELDSALRSPQEDCQGRGLGGSGGTRPMPAASAAANTRSRTPTAPACAGASAMRAGGRNEWGVQGGGVRERGGEGIPREEGGSEDKGGLREGGGDGRRGGEGEMAGGGGGNAAERRSCADRGAAVEFGAVPERRVGAERGGAVSQRRGTSVCGARRNTH